MAYRTQQTDMNVGQTTRVRGSKYVIIWPWAENKYRTQLADIHVGQTTRVRKSKHSKEQTPKRKRKSKYGNVTL